MFSPLSCPAQFVNFHGNLTSISREKKVILEKGKEMADQKKRKERARDHYNYLEFRGTERLRISLHFVVRFPQFLNVS